MPLVQNMRLHSFIRSVVQNQFLELFLGKSCGDPGVAVCECGLWLRGGHIEQPADY